MSYVFEQLPYSYDALEPHIDTLTMEIHYSKHHRTYYDKFVAAAAENNIDVPIIEIFKNMSKYSTNIRNNGGGYYNHQIFWHSLSPNGGGEPHGDLGKALIKKWGTYENFKEEFSKAAKTRFGSGFAWLMVNDQKELEITSTANQDNPLMDIVDKQGNPILALDVWEHAYYLKHQNRRPDYIKEFWNVVNWDFAKSEYKKYI